MTSSRSNRFEVLACHKSSKLFTSSFVYFRSVFGYFRRTCVCGPITKTTLITGPKFAKDFNTDSEDNFVIQNNLIKHANKIIIHIFFFNYVFFLFYVFSQILASSKPTRLTLILFLACLRIN